jgi:hypothetical protein
LSSKVNNNPLLQLGSPEGYIKLKRDPGSLIPFLCGDTVKSVADIGVQKSRFKSKNDLHKEPSSFYLSPGCPSILSHKSDTKSLANITSKISKNNSIPDLNLTGEQMCIKDNIMKVVNFESVISNLEEHLRHNAET